jgi:hypothetical protein
MTLRKLLILTLGCVVWMAAQERPAPTPKAPPLFKGDKNKKDDGTRMVKGVVRDASDNLLENAVVKCKDTKTLAIRSYITKNDGAFSFQGLSVGTDYELRAEGKDGQASSAKVLSVYDNRREAVMNLKLEPKK